jgi:hypothetical protein
MIKGFRTRIANEKKNDGSKQAIIGYGKMMSLDCLILSMTNNQISC